MSKKLQFACHFDNGTAIRLRVDLQEIRELTQGEIFAPDFQHNGNLPPPNELEDWAVKTFADLSVRARRAFTAQTPLGILWRFAPAKKPQKVEISPSQAILMATLTRGAAWQKITFANGGRGFWKVDLSNVPWRIEITISGPLPGDNEIDAWLIPLLTIPGAKEAFQQWPHQRTDRAGHSIEIEFAHKP